ncbi:MAG: 2'-5' RNA ligase family protein, partial [Pyrinomonadaceae bacterium]
MLKSKEMKRVFAAIDISDTAREAIGDYTSGLRSEFRDLRVRWEKPEKLHITIKFAGSVDNKELEQFMQLVKKAAASVAPFTVGVIRTGAFLK